MSIKLIIKQSNGDSQEVAVNPDCNVVDLKHAIRESHQIEVVGQRLLFKGKRNSLIGLGRILKDDQQTLAALKIENGMTVNLIRTNVVEQTPTAPPNKEKPKESLKFDQMPKNITPKDIEEIIKNPEMMKQFMSPNFMTDMMEKNPLVKEILNKNPELAKLVSTPEMKQILQQPDCVQRAMAGILEMQISQGQMPQPSPEQLNAFYSSFGGQGAPQGQPEPTQLSKDFRTLYASELASIKDMGFSDEEKILNELAKANGVVSVALEVLFKELA